MSVLEAVENGTYRDVLVALRDHIARVIDDDCSARDLVGLSKRLLDQVEELRAIDTGTRHLSVVDNADEPFDPAAI